MTSNSDFESKDISHKPLREFNIDVDIKIDFIDNHKNIDVNIH